MCEPVLLALEPSMALLERRHQRVVNFVPSTMAAAAKNSKSPQELQTYVQLLDESWQQLNQQFDATWAVVLQLKKSVDYFEEEHFARAEKVYIQLRSELQQQLQSLQKPEDRKGSVVSWADSNCPIITIANAAAEIVKKIVD